MGEDKKSLSLFCLLLLKNENKDTHYKYTNKIISVLFSGTIGIFSRAFKKLNEQI